MPDTETRVRVSLDGEWTFLTDPDGDGEGRGLQNPDADWPDAAESVTVPHAWQEDETHRDYTGTAWYRTTVEYDGSGDRVFLRFGAVDYEATVSVNGERVGSNRDGYLPFEVEATDAVEFGENTVVVEVTDPEDLDEIPHGKQGDPWYTRSSGVWQSVRLEARPDAFVDSVRATPNLGDDTVTVEVAAEGASSGTADVAVRRDGSDIANGSCELADGRGECELSISDPDYWTPETPALYDVEVTLKSDGEAVDAYEDYFGMRSFETDGDRFYLNGEPYYIRGALDQAYYPDTLYRPFDEDLFEYEIRTAKELGFNMLRKHIKPAHPDFLEAADRLGVLVWEEPANPRTYTERSKRELKDQLRGMIERDYNRPSVVVWSIYNEEWGIGLDQRDYSDHPERLWNDEEKQAYLTDLFEETKEWDPTRPVCDNSGWAHVATDINDYHEYFVSPDRAKAWEENLDHIVENPGENYGTENTPAEEAPIVISEFGTWGFPDLPKLRDHYGGDPTWFSHDFLESELKRPAGVDDRYEATDLPDVFDGYDELADVWQRREAVSVRDVIEQMRVRDDVAGYCITEFSDIEWEFNGILDYLRDPKENVADDFATCNDEVLVVVEPSRHAVAAGDKISLDVKVVNDTNEPLTGTLEWAALGDGGSETVSVDRFGTTTVAEGLAVAASTDATNGPRSVDVSFETDDRTVTNDVPVVVVADEDPGEVTVYADSPLDDRLEDAGADVTADLSAADVAVVESLSDDISAFVESGGAALVVPGKDGRMANESYRNLPAAESWNLVASLLYQDSELVSDLCSDARVGWAFNDLFPYDLVDDVGEGDEVHVGSVEGWIANWGSPLVVRPRGDGAVCHCTFRVTDAYGDHPTATLLVNRLLDRLAEE